MRIGLYARVSTERQQERGTVTSQLEALRAAADSEGHEIVEEFVDDGYSGARLDRPALTPFPQQVSTGYPPCKLPIATPVRPSKRC